MLFQILALLIGGLLVAQLVTLFLTLVLPPAPTPRHRLEDIALALKSGAGSPQGLERSIQSSPPAVSGAGWLMSETASADLAKMVEEPRGHVRLFFYAPAPFARSAPTLVSAQGSDQGFHLGEIRMESLFVSQALAQQNGQNRPQSFPRGGGMDGRGGIGNGTGGSPTGGMGSGLPGGLGGQRNPGGRDGQPDSSGGAARHDGPFSTPAGGERGGLPGRGPGDSSSSGARTGESFLSRIDRQERMPPREIPVPAGQSGPPAPARLMQPPQGGPLFSGQGLVPEAFGTRATPLPSETVPEPVERVARPEPSRAVAEAAPVASEGPASLAGGTSAITAQIPVVRKPLPDIQSIPVEAAARTGIDAPSDGKNGLFGLAPAPFVQGDFVAAMRLPDGQWSVVQLAAESFPNSWQSRVLLWFLCALALVTPLGWIFARRLVKPLIGFAQAAEQLGRDPTAPVLALGEGPAEVGRAARAFNQMQSRLRSFVDDRTAMVGAISHDLRTPLTRLRFRIEDVEDEARRDGMIAEVEEMEAMISSVLNFIREGSTHGEREYVDLPSLIGEMAQGWVETGADVTLVETDAEDVVDVDRLAVRRLIGNLVENAIKYGARARIRIWNDGQEAIVDIVDEGTGIAPDEQDRVFEPFYRTAEARASAKAGSGLGLAVCRSIARTHGGDVSLFHGEAGFTARLRLPLAFGHVGKLAA